MPPNAGTWLASLVRAIPHAHHSYSTDNAILVPLTTSLYVPGNLSDPEHVIVDVGTGYFVQKVSNAVPYTYTALHILTTYIDTSRGSRPLQGQSRVCEEEHRLLTRSTTDQAG